jgi:hypothetical protein
LTQQEATQLAQLLGQYQDVVRFVIEAGHTPGDTAAAILARLNFPGNPLAGAVFGFTALSFVYTYDAVVKSEGFPPAIVGVVDLGILNVTRNNAGTPQRPAETVQEACLRHLRNCFAHGRFQIHVVNNNTEITLHDENPGGAPTFDAHCDAVHVIELAERLMVAAYNHASAIAHQAAAPAAAPVPAAAAPLPGAAPAAVLAPTAALPAAVGAPPTGGNPLGGN